jgi:hypothetical protein
MSEPFRRRRGMELGRGMGLLIIRMMTLPGLLNETGYLYDASEQEY